MIDQNTLFLGISLLLLIGVNIILGGISGIFNKEFDVKKLFMGLAKGLIISFCFFIVLYIGKELTPNILLINVDGKEINLASATYLLMVSGYIFYGKQVLTKLSTFVMGDFKVNDVVEIASEKSPETIIQEEIKKEK